MRSEELCRLAWEKRDASESRLGVVEAEVKKYMAESTKLKELSAKLAASVAQLLQELAEERSATEAAQKDREGKY